MSQQQLVEEVADLMKGINRDEEHRESQDHMRGEKVPSQQAQGSDNNRRRDKEKQPVKS